MRPAVSFFRALPWLALLLATSPVWDVPLSLFPSVYGKMPFVLPLVALLGLGASFRAPAAASARLPAIAVGTYLAVAAVAAAFGVDPERSVFGIVARATGLVTTAMLAVWFFSLRRVLDARGWNRFWWAAFGTAAAEALFVLAQAGVGFATGAITLGTRLYGHLGNPTYLAGYLTMSAAILGILWPRAGRRARAVLAAGAVAIAGAILLTGSRSGTLGLASVAAVLAIGAAWQGSRRVRWTVAGLLVVILLTGATLMAVPPERLTSVGLPAAISRAVDIRDAFENAPRRIQLEIARQAFLERPILGWGPENYQVAFDLHYRPELLRHSFSETVSDKPHNVLLEILVAGGVPLAVAWLSLVAVALGAAVRAVRQGKMRVLEAAGAVAMTGAFILHGLFLFETYATSLLFFALLAWLAAGSGVPQAVAGSMRRAVCIVGVAVFAVFALLAGPLAAPALVATLNATEAATPEAWSGAARFAVDATSVHRREILKHLDRDFINRSSQDVFPASFYSANVSMLRAATEREAARHPDDFTLRFMLAQLLSIEAATSHDPTLVERALDAMASAQALSPRRQAVAFQRAKLLLQAGRATEAVELLRAIVADDPTLQEPHWFLGIALSVAGDDAAAAEELFQSLQRGRRAAMASNRSIKEIVFVIDAFAKVERYPDIVPLYEVLIELEPMNALWHGGLAATYAAQGKMALAVLEANRAAELEPAYQKQADEFLQLLRDASRP